MLVGIYAGNSENLSTLSIFPFLVHMENTYGSVVLGALWSVFKAFCQCAWWPIRRILCSPSPISLADQYASNIRKQSRMCVLALGTTSWGGWGVSPSCSPHVLTDVLLFAKAAFSFKCGMGQLPNRLSEVVKADILLNCPAKYAIAVAVACHNRPLTHYEKSNHVCLPPPLRAYNTALFLASTAARSTCIMHEQKSRSALMCLVC